MKAGKANRDPKRTALLLGILAVLFIVLGLAGVLKPRLQIGYVSRSDSKSWSASYAYYTGERTQRISPEDGSIHMEVETNGGTLDILVEDEYGETVYQQSGVPTGAFDVTAPPKAVVTVTASGHGGGFKFTW